jgi:hypothetical protein
MIRRRWKLKWELQRSFAGQECLVDAGLVEENGIDAALRKARYQMVQTIEKAETKWLLAQPSPEASYPAGLLLWTAFVVIETEGPADEQA